MITEMREGKDTQTNHMRSTPTKTG